MTVTKTNKIFFVAGGVIATFCVLYASVWFFPLFWLKIFHSCDTEVTSVISNGTYSVEESVKNCGATSDYSTEYVIKNIKSKSMDTVLSLKGDYTKSCEMQLKNENLMIINCLNADEYIYAQKNQFENITIQFYQNGVLKYNFSAM